MTQLAQLAQLGGGATGAGGAAPADGAAGAGILPTSWGPGDGGGILPNSESQVSHGLNALRQGYIGYDKGDFYRIFSWILANGKLKWKPSVSGKGLKVGVIQGLVFWFLVWGLWA